MRHAKNWEKCEKVFLWKNTSVVVCGGDERGSDCWDNCGASLASGLFCGGDVDRGGSGGAGALLCVAADDFYRTGGGGGDDFGAE